MGTPIPNKSNEMKGRGASEVVTYRLSPEEIAALGPAKPIPRSHTKPIGFESDKQPVLKRTAPVGAIEDYSSETQRRRALSGHQKRRENANMADQKLTREQYLKLRVEGKSRKEIAKLHGYTLSHLESYWLKKWGIKDQIQEEIAIAEAFAPAAEGDNGTSESDGNPGTANPPAPTGLIAYNAARSFDELTAQLAAEVEASQTKDAEIERLRDELANVLGERNGLQEALKGSEFIVSQSGERIRELEESVASLEDEREMLLQTIERAAAPSAAAGNLDVMDVVEAAVIGLAGGQAYSAGAALEHLWTWSPTDGVANLLKARRHIDRLIAGLEADAG